MERKEVVIEAYFDLIVFLQSLIVSMPLKTLCQTVLLKTCYLKS